MDRFTAWVIRRRRWLLGAWIVLLLAGGAFAGKLEERIVPGGEAPDSSGSQEAARALEDSPLPELFVVARREEGAGRPAAAAVRRLERRLEGVPGVTRVTPVRGERRDAPAVVLNVATTGGFDGSIEVAKELRLERGDIEPRGLDIRVGGLGAYNDELTKLTQTDLGRAERFGLPIVFVVLLLTFGTLWAAVLPLMIALSAVTVGLGILSIVGTEYDLSEYVTSASTIIGIALGVDYAMFLVQRLRETLRQDRDVEAAIAQAMRTTGVAVLWSGGTVLVAEATLFLVDSRAIRSGALGLMIVTALAMVSAVVLAPILFYLMRKRVLRSLDRESQRAGVSRWRRWGQAVTRRAPLTLLLSVAALVALSVPALDLGDDVQTSPTSSLPESAGVRQAYQLAEDALGPGAMSPVQIALTPDGNPRRAAARVVRAVREHPEVRRVQAVPPGRGEDVVPVVVTPRHGAYDDRTRDLVESLTGGELRDQLAGLRYEVGGETAVTIDQKDALFGSLPLVIGVLLVLVAGFLFLVFRSLFIPLKAILLVVVTLTASLGGLLLLTQTEFGATLIGEPGPSEINPFVPVTIVAIIVALSTDYEVILIARIAEHFRRTGDNTAAIVEGVASTGRVITSAAAIMVALFLGFALADLATLKHLGLGLALSVLFDATIVRGATVPAAMQVMGRWNWWPGAGGTLGRERSGAPRDLVGQEPSK